MVLKGITWDHPRGYEPLVAAAAAYEKKSGIRIEWQKRSLALFGDQSIDELSRHFDLLIVDHPHVGIMTKTKCISPISDFISKSEMEMLQSTSGEPSFSSYTYDQKQLALPIDAAFQTAAYRPDLLASLTVPQDWEQVFHLAVVLKKKGLQMGMALCPTDCLCSFLSLTAQLGSPIREENKRLVNPEIGILALEYLRKLRDLVHDQSLDWNPIQLYDYMSDHDDIAYSPLGFCYTNYSRAGFRKKLLSFTNPPGTKNAVLGGAGISVSSNSAHPGEAAGFANWVSSGKIQSDLYIMAQGQPAHQQAWHDEQANLTTHNFFRQCLAGLQTAYIRPRYPGWPAFQQRIGEIIHGFLSNDLEIHYILGMLDEQYKASLSGSL
jgi:multiple sugar transport system substrate-binding protein